MGRVRYTLSHVLNSCWRQNSCARLGSVRMGRVRYTPNHVLKEVVLARKCLGETWFGSDGQSQIHTQSCLEVVLGTELLGETWFDADGQSQIHTQPCLEGNRVGEETLIRDLVRMGKVRYIPSCVLKAVVLAMKILGETWFGADGQSQIHTQPRLEGSRIGEETLGRDRDRMS